MEQEVPNEFLLVIDDGEAPEEEDQKDQKPGKPETRGKGAYYKNIERKMLLKKKRQNVRASYTYCTDMLAVLTECRPTNHIRTSGTSSR